MFSLTPGPPALHHGGIQTTAQLAALTQTFLSCFFFIFTSVKWNSKYASVSEVIFIIIIIINIIVSLPWCFVESKVLDTSLTED